MLKFDHVALPSRTPEASARFLAGLLGGLYVSADGPEGEFMRRQGPFAPEDELHAFGGFFQSINRNKRGIVLDLKQAEDREILTRLVESADVVVARRDQHPLRAGDDRDVAPPGCPQCR